MQHAVDAKADAPVVFERLDVDIRRAARGGFAQRFGDERNGRGAGFDEREGVAGESGHGKAEVMRWFIISPAFVSECLTIRLNG